MSAAPDSAADELLALAEATVLDDGAETETAPESLLSLTQVARMLKVRKRDVKLAAARLGLHAGAEIRFDSLGRLLQRQLWPVEWLDELRVDLDRGADIDLADLCGLPQADDMTH